MNNSIFEGKNCLVTGATGGLGKAICKQLSERDCNIFLTSKTRSKLVQLKKNLSKHKGIKIEFENGDLTSISDVNKIIRKSNKKFNHIDILINCAGIFPVKKLSESTFQDFQECFDLNVRAPFLLTKELNSLIIFVSLSFFSGLDTSPFHKTLSIITNPFSFNNSRDKSK